MEGSLSLTDSRANQDYVFGYGSLLRDRPKGERLVSVAQLCHLAGYRRAWNVATDNTQTIPGYKCYIDPVERSRPEVFVTFVNLVPNEGHSVSGVVFAVDDDDLAALDRRERNYERQDVTELVSEDVGGRIWTYIGTSDARARYREGMQTRRAVVNRRYIEGVRAGFASFSEAALEEFEATTDPPECPIVDLERVDLR